MTEPRFDAIGIVVADMEPTLAFYRLMGLTFPAGSAQEGHVEATTAGGVRIMFDTEELVRGFDPSFEPPTSRGRIGLAFLCDSPAEVDRVHASVDAAGYDTHLPPFDAVWGQRYCTVIDPNGNLVDLFAPLG